MIKDPIRTYLPNRSVNILTRSFLCLSMTLSIGSSNCHPACGQEVPPPPAAVEESAAPAAPAPQKGLPEADELLIAGKLKAAEEAYKKLLEGDETGDAYAGLSVSLAKQNLPLKIVEAERLLKKARESFATNPNVMAAAGFVAYVHSRSVASPAKRDLYLEAAENLCKKAIKASPDTVIAHQTLGLVKMAQDDYDGAVTPLKRAVSIAETAANLTYLAQALLKLDPHDKDAEEYIEKAIAAKGDYHAAHLQKAIILLNQGKNEEAFMELKGIPQSERVGEWFLTEGDVYRKQGDGPGALASWNEAIRLDPHSPDPYRRRAEYYSIRGDGELAIAEMHNALEILPNDLPLRNELAELALRQDKLDVAETEYRTILGAQPEDPQALLGLSRVYWRKSRKDGRPPADMQELMDKLQNVVTEQSVRGQMIKQGARNLQENIKLSEAEKALGLNKTREATRLFSEVISEHRDDGFELLTLGEQAFHDGDLRAAEQAYTYAKEIPEVSSRAEQGMSKIQNQRNEAARQTKLGDAAAKKIPEVAEDHYKQALIADPQNPSPYYGLFHLYSEGDKPNLDQAVEFGERFLEAADDANPLRKEVEANMAKIKKRGPAKAKGK